MEKNGTNQLGITLGYDAKASSLGSLFVCEVHTYPHIHRQYTNIKGIKANRNRVLAREIYCCCSTVGCC